MRSTGLRGPSHWESDCRGTSSLSTLCIQMNRNPGRPLQRVIWVREGPRARDVRIPVSPTGPGKAIGEVGMVGRQAAQSTVTATTGRISAYTAHALKWDRAVNPSKFDLDPAEYESGDLPVVPVPTPVKRR